MSRTYRAYEEIREDRDRRRMIAEESREVVGSRYEELETVAEAIYERARAINTSREFPVFSGAPSSVRTDYFELADAALKALRESEEAKR